MRWRGAMLKGTPLEAIMVVMMMVVQAAGHAMIGWMMVQERDEARLCCLSCMILDA